MQEGGGDSGTCVVASLPGDRNADVQDAIWAMVIEIVSALIVSMFEVDNNAKLFFRYQDPMDHVVIE